MQKSLKFIRDAGFLLLLLLAVLAAFLIIAIDKKVSYREFKERVR